MSIKTKKRFKNLGKIISVALFAALMFTNVKISLFDNSELSNGDISLLGVELELFEATISEPAVLCTYHMNHICSSYTQDYRDHSPYGY